MVLTKGISSICDRQNYSKCDRCILNLLRQNLMQTEGNVKLTKEQQILEQLRQVFARLGVIIVTSQGQVQFITQRGEQLLNQYFEDETPELLPASLRNWLKHEILSLKFDNQVPPSCIPLQIETKGKQLLIRLIANLIEEQYLILLEEQKLRSFSIASLELLGLTKREAEVLFWVAKDKSNAGIAKILSCSKGTVRKHLEHIHQKLGVQTRTAAVMVALEKLGLLKGGIVAISS
ncbi:MAG: response regulator transcription factor [Prochloraceae cyanobacterium]